MEVRGGGGAGVMGGRDRDSVNRTPSQEPNSPLVGIVVGGLSGAVAGASLTLLLLC